MGFFNRADFGPFNPNINRRTTGQKDISNKIFCYITTTSISRDTSSADSSTTNTDNLEILSTTFINLEISLNTFIIGLIINEIQRGKRSYNENETFHPSEEVNEFIHNTLQENVPRTMETIPNLTFVYGNAAAVLPIYTQVINITPLNFFIVLALHKLEANAVETSNGIFVLSRLSRETGVIELLKFYQPLTGTNLSAGEE